VKVYPFWVPKVSTLSMKQAFAVVAPQIPARLARLASEVPKSSPASKLTIVSIWRQSVPWHDIKQKEQRTRVRCSWLVPSPRYFAKPRYCNGVTAPVQVVSERPAEVE